MPSVRTHAALVVAALVVAAGCAAPTSVGNDQRAVADQSDATTPSTTADESRTTTHGPQTTDEPPTQSEPAGTTTAPPDRDDRTIEARGGPLPVNQTRVFARVQRLLGTNVTRPEYVSVADDRSGNATAEGGRSPRLYRFWRLVGVESERALDRSERRETPNGVVTLFGGIRLYPPADYTASSIEWVLAHEYVHYVQYKNRRSAALRRTLSRATTDNSFVVRSVLEGAAVFTTDAYLRRYADGDRLNSDLYAEYDRRLSPGSRQQYRNRQYLAGHRYVADRIDSPDRLPAVYDRPPRTSEQVLHGYPPGVEPARPLPVTVNASDSPWRRAGTDTMGEAFVRTAVRNGLNDSRARRAAAGWGNDTLYTFRRDAGNASYAWVLRWDDARNASEFASAFAASLDARGSASDGTWTVEGATVDVRSPGEEWTVVLAGPDGFVRGTAASVAAGNLSVSAAGN